MRARVYVSLKPGVLDPAGTAVEHGLKALGFSEVQSVRLGKYIELDLEAADAAAAKARVESMSQKLLANGVVEAYRVEVLP